MDSKSHSWATPKRTKSSPSGSGHFSGVSNNKDGGLDAPCRGCSSRLRSGGAGRLRETSITDCNGCIDQGDQSMERMKKQSPGARRGEQSTPKKDIKKSKMMEGICSSEILDNFLKKESKLHIFNLEKVDPKVIAVPYGNATATEPAETSSEASGKQDGVHEVRAQNSDILSPSSHSIIAIPEKPNNERPSPTQSGPSKATKRRVGRPRKPRDENLAPAPSGTKKKVGRPRMQRDRNLALVPSGTEKKISRPRKQRAGANAAVAVVPPSVPGRLNGTKRKTRRPLRRLGNENSAVTAADSPSETDTLILDLERTMMEVFHRTYMRRLSTRRRRRRRKTVSTGTQVTYADIVAECCRNTFTPHRPLPPQQCIRAPDTGLQYGPVATTSSSMSRVVSSGSSPSYDLEKIAFPFTLGWHREVVRSLKATSEGTRRTDVYYISPTGVKLRSKPEITRYLWLHGDRRLTDDNFTFTREKVFMPPFETERWAQPASLRL